jgi:hypothetical protein
VKLNASLLKNDLGAQHPGIQSKDVCSDQARQTGNRRRRGSKAPGQ